MLRWLGRIFVVLLILGVVAGCFIGNIAFEEFRTAPWDTVLGIENHSRNSTQMRQLEKERDWEPVRVNGIDGTMLRGTYIADKRGSHQTVILLHGLYQNRVMCLPYVSIYRNLGYNVLLIDLRGHGESGGEHTDWGLSEIDDLTQWIQWLHERDGNMKIGMHGISLGAAMALLYAGSDRGGSLSFVVADSSYGNIIALGREKLRQTVQDERVVWGYNILDPFFQAAMLFHTHKLVANIEPAQAVRFVKAPILFLHGGQDKLVPVQTAQDLYEKCGSQDKYVYVFSQSPHAVGIETNTDAYRRVVTRFLRNRHVQSE